MSRSASSARSSERCEAGTFSGSASPSLVTVKVPSVQRGDVPVPHALGRQLRCLRRVAGGRRRARRVARAPHQPLLSRAVDELAERLGQLRGRVLEVAARANVQCVCAVHALSDCQLAEDALRVLGQVAVDPHLAVVDIDQPGVLPARLARGLVGVAAAEDQQVHQRVGAGRSAVRTGRQPDRADQVRQGAHLASGGRVGGVERVVGAEHGDQPARPREMQGLEDEVVVQAVGAGVVAGVVQAHVGERHVPDREVEVGVRQPCAREGLGADVGVGVQRSSDCRGGGVELDADELRLGGGEAEEDPGAAPGLQHPAPR